MSALTPDERTAQHEALALLLDLALTVVLIFGLALLVGWGSVWLH